MAFRTAYAAQTSALAEELEAARAMLPHVTIPSVVEEQGMALVQALRIPSHRAEIAMFEGARAHAAADLRSQVRSEDLRRVAPLALRQRQSPHIEEHARRQALEQGAIMAAIEQILDG